MNGLLLLLITVVEIVLLVFAFQNYDAVKREERLNARIEANPELKAFEFSDEELRLIPGQKLLAIKLVRERTGLNLRDAYSVVDFYSRRNKK